MNFDLSPELLARAASSRRWAEAVLAAPARPPGFDADGWSRAAGHGVLSLPLPATWGGGGEGALGATVVLEALGRGGADRGLLLAISAHLFGCALPTAAFATPEQTLRWAAGLRSGTTIGALAVTEPGGGSSFDKLATAAVETADGYVLNGHKTLICNAPRAGLFLLLARQFPDRGVLGLTAFLVPRRTDGLTVAPIDTISGLRGAPMGDVHLHDCLVPRDAVLGRPGTGLKVFMTAMQWERSCLLAGFLGAAERDLAACARALRDRDAALIRHQAVSHRLARTKLRLENARLMLRRAAWSIDRGKDDQVIAAMTKLTVSEAIVACAEDAARLMAGTGWAGKPFDTAAALVDTLGGLFASGTSEVQLDFLAHHVLAESARD